MRSWAELAFSGKFVWPNEAGDGFNRQKDKFTASEGIWHDEILRVRNPPEGGRGEIKKNKRLLFWQE